MIKTLKITFIFLVAAMVNVNSIQAQDKRLEKANKAYKNFHFIEAAKLYKSQVNKNNTVELYTKLGDCYYFVGDYVQAVQYYSKVVTAANKIDEEYFFRYAQALNSVKNYSESEAIMKAYYQKSGKKDLSGNWNEKKLFADIAKQSGRYDFKEVNLNTNYSEFGTAFYGNEKILFASAKDNGMLLKSKDNWNDKSFLKLYSADITLDGGLQNAEALKGDINTKYHQSTPAVTKDGKRMFFTRNNYADGKLAMDKAGTSYLKIYTAENVDGVWKNIKELGYPVNSDGFSSAHPALNADETELYFASDRNNKFGDSDLYVVSLKKGGFVGNDVKKLGDEINTLGRETYPFVDASGVLYFASDGHPGLGGLDVFAALKDDKGEYHVVNVGDGVNSTADDFAYIIDAENKKGYFSSDRKGNDDIYSFTERVPVNFDFNIKPLVYGTVKFQNGNPIEKMAIEVYNAENEKTQTVYSDAEGKYSVNLEAYKAHKLVYKKAGIAEKITLASQLKPTEKKEYSHEFLNELDVIVDNKVITLKEGDDLTKRLNLNPIYFDYGGYKIRESSKAELDKIVDVLKGRQSISMKINSHTDSRGRDEFNLKLSENRAQATVDYIVAHGIDKERISGQGFGETKLINKCSNGVKCSEAQHQENRRSEFIIFVK